MKASHDCLMLHPEQRSALEVELIVGEIPTATITYNNQLSVMWNKEESMYTSE